MNQDDTVTLLDPAPNGEINMLLEGRRDWLIPPPTFQRLQARFVAARQATDAFNELLLTTRECLAIEPSQQVEIDWAAGVFRERREMAG